MKALPAWTQGGVILAMTGGRAKVTERYRKLRDAGVPVAGLWLQVIEFKKVGIEGGITGAQRERSGCRCVSLSGFLFFGLS